MARRRSYYGLNTNPWVVEEHSKLRSSGGRQVDWTAVPEWFRETPGQYVVVGAAGAAQGAVAVPVDALMYDIPSGTVLSFGGAKFARLTAPAAAGAVALTVAALPTALVDNDLAVIPGKGEYFIPPGTFYVEVTPGGKVAPRAGVGVVAALAGKTARFISESATESGNRNDALTGYGMLVGVSAFENLMPDADEGGALPADYVTEFRANGGLLNLFQYGDSRAG